ncbi:MAG TPA: MGMT family protein [Candidatus Paceibacterota bacterium]|nr:MGMT family protein [Candidatus Paceibacterota bacterium]
MRTRRSDNTLRERVFAVVRLIPAGQTLSYGEVARRVGRPGAARAVGAILHTNHDPAIPCHRVIKADGSPGGYNGGEAKKRERLAAEGAL